MNNKNFTLNGTIFNLEFNQQQNKYSLDKDAQAFYDYQPIYIQAQIDKYLSTINQNENL